MKLTMMADQKKRMRHREYTTRAAFMRTWLEGERGLLLLFGGVLFDGGIKFVVDVMAASLLSIGSIGSPLLIVMAVLFVYTRSLSFSD